MHVLNDRERECFVILEVTTSQHNEFISLHFFLFLNLNKKSRRVEKSANISTEQGKVPTCRPTGSLSTPE